MQDTDTLPLRYLFLDLNSYFASVEQQLHPELRGRPVAVVPAETDATCAIAASYEAKAYGIKTGTMIYDARRMCPELVCVVARHEHYVEYHHRVLEEVDRHLPVYSVDSIDELSCKLLGAEGEEENALALARRIKGGLKQNVGECIRASVGLSTNRYLAKVATDLQKPDGLVVLRPEMLPERLHGLPLDTLPGIGRNMYRRLLRAGIGDMETLWRQNPKQLRAVWGGVQGERFWYKLRGHELPAFETQRRSIGHSHVLEPQWRPAPLAWQVAERLTQKAAARLRRYEFYATHLALSVRIEQGGRYSAEAKFAAACDNITLLRELKILWTDILRASGGDTGRVKKISVALYGFASAQNAFQQLSLPDLFGQSTASSIMDYPHKAGNDEETRKRYERASHAMDTLNARYGRDTVVMGFLPSRSHAFSGTKVAFTRIPEREEFYE